MRSKKYNSPIDVGEKRKLCGLCLMCRGTIFYQVEGQGIIVKEPKSR